MLRNFLEMNPVEPNYFTEDLIKYCVDPSDTKYLHKIDNIEISQILPFLVRLWKKSQDNAQEIKNTIYKREIFRKINKYSKTNNIFFYLDANFSQIYDDIIRTLSLRLELFRYVLRFRS